MSNNNYYRWGDKEIIKVPVDDTVVVEIGDFICLIVAADVTDDATNLTLDYGCPPGYLVDVGDDTANREKTADQFLGIAMSASLNGKTDDLLVATAGVFELIQKSAAVISIGDGVEIYSDSDNCEAQTIVKGDTSAIAVCIEHKVSTTLTAVMCKLLPSKLLGHRQELHGT